MKETPFLSSQAKESQNQLVPITEQEQKFLHSIVFDGRLHDRPEEENVVLLGEKEGLNRLGEFSWRGGSSNRLNPFILKIAEKATTEKNSTSISKTIYRSGKYEIHQLTFSIPQEIVNVTNGKILVVPRILSRGRNPYYWLEFYSSEVKQSPRPFIGCRLRPNEEKRKTDFQHWHSIEEELLADFIERKNNIKFKDVMAFEISINNSYQYRIAARKGMEICPGQNSLINIGDILRITLNQYITENKQYIWISVDKTLPVEETTKLTPVTGYSIDRTNRRFLRKFWPGIERQLLQDYANGTVPFNELKPCLLEKNKISNLRIHLFKNKGVNVYLQLSETWPLVGKDVFTLVPAQESDNGSTFILTRGNEQLGLYAFNIQKRVFMLMDNYYTKKENEHVLVYEKRDGIYKDEDGNLWISLGSLRKKFYLNPSKLKIVAQQISQIVYQPTGLKKHTYYNYLELLEALKKLNILPREKNPPPSANEANAWLEQILKEE